MSERRGGDTGEPVVFYHAVEGLLRGLGVRVTRPLQDEMCALGVDPDRLLPLYPRATWFALLTMLATRVWPHLGADAAFRELGRAVFSGYGRTLVGVALMRMMTLLGPRGALDRVRKSFRTADNYTESRLTPLGPSSVELWMGQTGFNPHYVEGIVLEMLERVFALKASVVIASSDDTGIVYRITWSS